MIRKVAIVSTVLLTVGMGAWLFTIAARELQVNDAQVADAITGGDPIVILQTATAPPAPAATQGPATGTGSSAGNAIGYADEDDDDDEHEEREHDDDEHDDDDD